MNPTSPRRALFTAGALALITTIIVPVAYGKTKETPATAPKEVYTFKHATPVRHLEPYTTSLYSNDATKVQNLRGIDIVSGNDTVTDMRVSPAGNALTVVSRDKKGRYKAGLYDVLNADTRLMKFDSKKFGAPTACCFTPDARALLVAAGGKIYKLEMRKYQIIDVIDNVPFAPTAMCMSSNGYFLALSSGNKVAVYNFESKKIRKEIDYDDPVNEMAFSPDNSDFAVLTADGILTIYGTKTFDMRKMADDLGQGLAFAYNFDGKYVGVVTDPDHVMVVNLLRDSDRDTYEQTGGASDIVFLSDSNRGTLMAYPQIGAIEVRRMPHLKPYYNKLINEAADRMMDEWLKMQPGETMGEYQARVTDESRRRQRHLFEDAAATEFAGDLLDGQMMQLGQYDRANGVLALDFNQMNTIYVPMPESEVLAIKSTGDLAVSDVQYGVLPDDSFEIVYAKVTNRPTGNSFIYDNHNRARMEYMNADDAISLELLQQQQLEEMKLQELRQKVIAEAKKQNVISDHTNITVDSKVVPDVDADGNKILNYNISFTYTVEPGFSATEDFGPGKYHVAESGAASSMLRIVKEAFEGDLKQYVKPGKKLLVSLKGTADASPILRGIPYDGSYGEIENEPVTCDGQLTALTVTTKDGIKENPQLALVRAMGVQDFLEKNVEGLGEMKKDYRYSVDVSKDKGSEFRRITAEFTLVDAF